MKQMQFADDTNSGLTMSSREIAELCDKQHFHVCRDIIRMLKELEIGESRFGCSYLSEQNKRLTEYRLPKNLTLTLVSGYNVKLRKRIIDRWIKLEGQAPKLTQIQILLQSVQLLADVERRQVTLEQQQLDSSKRLDIIETKQADYETGAEHFAVTAYDKVYGHLKVNNKLAATIGRRCSTICKANGYPIGKAPHPLFGEVNTYPKVILDQVYEEERIHH